MLYAVNHKREREDFESKLVDHLFGEIACRIGDDLICHDSSLCLMHVAFVRLP